VVRSLIRDNLPWPPLESGGEHAGLVGLVRAVDGRGHGHVYGAGSVPAGPLAGALGALVASAMRDSVPLSMSPEGYLVTPGRLPSPNGRGPTLAARWTLAPLTWRDASVGLGERARSTAERVRRLAAPRRPGPSGPTGTPVGWLHRDGGEGRLPLYSALHPVTGDQLLTTDARESVELGYGDPDLLGHLEAHAPVTGRLGVESPPLPWASRLGRRRSG
jgi:hypothetical protein